MPSGSASGRSQDHRDTSYRRQSQSQGIVRSVWTVPCKGFSHRRTGRTLHGGHQLLSPYHAHPMTAAPLPSIPLLLKPHPGPGQQGRFQTASTHLRFTASPRFDRDTPPSAPACLRFGTCQPVPNDKPESRHQNSPPPSPSTHQRTNTFDTLWTEQEGI